MGLRWACASVLLLGMLFALPAFAQQTTDDAAAREYFKAGRAAFDQSDYESALIYFRHAYRTSGRGALLYNIGVASDRLQREQEALEAFEKYLEETDTPARESEVRTRIEALRKSIAEKEATERELMEAKLRYEAIAQEKAIPSETKSDAAPLPSASNVAVPVSPPASAAFQMPTYKGPADQPAAKKKKWPWIVAAAAVVVAGGVTAGVVISQRSNQSPPPGGGFSVNW
ncbi:MAG: hypothetical protein WCB63_19145 [Polyangiales bacterium]